MSIFFIWNYLFFHCNYQLPQKHRGTFANPIKSQRNTAYNFMHEFAIILIIRCDNTILHTNTHKYIKIHLEISTFSLDFSTTPKTSRHIRKSPSRHSETLHTIFHIHHAFITHYILSIFFMHRFAIL